MDDHGTSGGLLALVERSSKEYRRFITQRSVPRWWVAAEQPKEAMLQQARAVHDAELLSAVEALAAINVRRDQPLPPEGFETAYERVWQRTLKLRLETASE